MSPTTPTALKATFGHQQFSSIQAKKAGFNLLTVLNLMAAGDLLDMGCISDVDPTDASKVISLFKVPFGY